MEIFWNHLHLSPINFTCLSDDCDAIRRTHSNGNYNFDDDPVAVRSEGANDVTTYFHHGTSNTSIRSDDFVKNLHQVVATHTKASVKKDDKADSTRVPPAPPMLPPCRVCGERASGFHYGANTCEACKGFFRRSLYRKESYHCLGSNECTILPGKRNVCASCRYRKCISIGMSKNAIKTGRYTHEKKTNDIREVKRLQRQHQQQQRQGEEALDEVQGRFLIGGSSVGRMNDGLMDGGDDVDAIVDRIMATHRLQTPHTREFFDKLPSKEAEYLKCRQLQQNVFGSLKPIACQEYFKIYNTTGIDLDGRRAMMEHMIPCIEKAVKRFVAFAKAIPGFKDFPMEDQIKLIKGSRFEAWLISTYRAFNSDHLIYTHFCGYTVHLEDMSRIYDVCFLDNVFKVCNMIKKLDLSEIEECIIKSILLLFGDRSPLKAADDVERTQLKMIDILLHVRARRNPRDRNFLSRVTSVFVELRTLTHLHTVQENKISTEWSSNVHMPPLLYDLFSF